MRATDGRTTQMEKQEGAMENKTGDIVTGYWMEENCKS